MLPVTEIGKIAEDDVSDERRPNLPLHRLFIVTYKVTELQTLLEFLEEDFNRPAAFVEIANAARREAHVVADEDHDLLLAVDDYSSFNPPKTLRIGCSTLRSLQDDLVITQHLSLSAGFLALPNDSVSHVVFGSCYPRDVLAGQFIEMIEVDVGFVEDHDFPCFYPMTDFPSAF